MHTSRKIGTDAKHVSLYSFVIYERAGTVDDDGVMRTDSSMQGRNSVGVVWKGFEALISIGFRCKFSPPSNDMDVTLAWRRSDDERFTSRQMRTEPDRNIYRRVSAHN